MEIADLKSYFASLAEISDAAFESFAAGLRETTFAKGRLFTRIGDANDRVGFVKSGVFKVYYLTADGKAVIRNFCREGTPLGSYATILVQRPAHVNIEALEDAVVLETTYSHMEQFFSHDASWERLGRRIAEGHYISRERREYQLLSLDARGRYEAFKEDFPGLESRVTQSDIASYIGVDPATLSRLRAKNHV